MNGLKGKVALVTGGSRGIGAAVATRLAREGADAALTYVKSADKAGRVVDEIRSVGRHGVAIAADSADPDALVAAVERTVAHLGRLDILVNNAGVFPYGPIEDVTVEEIDRTLAVHVRGVFVVIQAAAPHLAHGGRIINIGSCFAERVPTRDVALYSMSKSALIGLTKGLARDLGGREITVNLVHPGPTDTDMNPADGPDAEEERRQTALGRYGTAADTAAMVAHLAGQGGRWITGTSIAVDGGYAA